MPNARTKQTAARAEMSATIAPPSEKFSRTSPGVEANPNSNAWNVTHSLDEPVQERQAGDRHRADEEAQAGPRHPSQQSAELLDLPRARRHHHAARAEEQQALEHRVIQHVHEARGHGHRRQRALAVRQRQHPRAQAKDR